MIFYWRERLIASWPFLKDFYRMWGVIGIIRWAKVFFSPLWEKLAPIKKALWANRWLLLAAVVLLAFALWISVRPVGAQTGGYCTFGHVHYWQDGRYITEGRWFCTGWQTPRRVTWRW